jgi:tetratricopeptide (TPR) repeat protein
MQTKKRKMMNFNRTETSLFRSVPWIIGTPAILAEQNLSSPNTGIGLKASEGLAKLSWVLLLISAVVILVFAIWLIIKYLRAVREKGLVEKMTSEAQKNERAGEFVSAAAIHETLKNLEKAAVLYEKGGDFLKAASMYESTGNMKKVREMYEKSGDLDNAAEAGVIAGDYVDAAKIYDKKGDKLKAAQALEMSGNRLAAVRAYREAKDYVKAAMLLREEGMYKEASEMYRISLAGEDVGASNIEKYYAYASLLETAGEQEKACEILKRIVSVNPRFKDVREKLQAMSIVRARENSDSEKTAGVTQEIAESAIIKETTLRNLLQAGGIEPRYSFRLWVQILKEIDRSRKEGIFLENLSPESILIDNNNNIVFDEGVSKNFAYISPEVVSGGKPDQISIIYSMGIILYEMLAGSLDSLGMRRPRELAPAIPEWLEALTLRCIERDRAGRYQSLEEIFANLLALKNKM